MSFDHTVLVAGAGPAGLVLAGELALAGVDVAVLERRTEPDTTIRAGAVTYPGVHFLDRRGLMDGALEAQASMWASLTQLPASGPRRVGHFAALPLSLDLVDPDDPELARAPGPVGFMLALLQHQLESLLRDWVADLGIPVHTGLGLRSFVDHDTHVEVRDDHGRPWSAAWLVGCDGGRSPVRRALGVDFPGTDPEITGRQALVDVSGDEGIERGWQRTPTGVMCLGPTPGRMLTVEFDGPPADRDAPVTAAELEGSLRRVSGVDVRVTAVHSATRWTDNARLAAEYRRGRVLLAGDAAHVHSPFGGQGLALSMGDGADLGWKLAATVHGWAPPGLLDTYAADRRPVAESVLDWTRAQVALMRPEPKTDALRALTAELLDTVTGTTFVARRLAGLHRSYLARRPDDGPEVGTLAPDVVLDDGRRLAEVARDARFVLVGDAAVRARAAGLADRVTAVAGPSPLLVRPDGVVAWDGTGPLEPVLSRWCACEQFCGL